MNKYNIGDYVWTGGKYVERVRVTGIQAHRDTVLYTLCASRGTLADKWYEKDIYDNKNEPLQKNIDECLELIEKYTKEKQAEIEKLKSQMEE